MRLDKGTTDSDLLRGFDTKKVSEAYLKTLVFDKKSIYQPPSIAGVILKELPPRVDGRGDVIEMWSLPWVDSDGFVIARHSYQSATDFGVVKCWHLHQKHTDQFAVTRGKLQVNLVDIRPSSPTFCHVNTVYMGIERPRLLKIPPGVLHGWKALTAPEVIVVNYQSEVYDPKDEFKFVWDCILKDLWEPHNG